MNKELNLLISRRLLSVKNYSEAIDYEQNCLLLGMLRDRMVQQEQFFDEDWHVAIIIGDPGLGKSVLLESFQRDASNSQRQLKLQLLKVGFNQDTLKALVEPNDNNELVLLFDGFDELISSQVVPFYNALKAVSNAKTKIRIVISSRTTFAQRHERMLRALNPRIYLLDRLSNDEVTQYMTSVDAQTSLIEHSKEWFDLQRGTNIVSVPRYLKYVCEYLKIHLLM